MNYTSEQLNADFRHYNETVLEPIRIDRGSRYGDDGDGDTLSNVATFGWLGAIINAFECMKRLVKIWKATVRFNKPINYDDVFNAIDDGINYLFYVRVLLKREMPQKSEPYKPQPLTKVETSND